MKLSSAPESTNTCKSSNSREHWRDAGRRIRVVGLGKDVVWLTNVPLYTGEPDLLAEPGRWRDGVRADRSGGTAVG